MQSEIKLKPGLFYITRIKKIDCIQHIYLYVIFTYFYLYSYVIFELTIHPLLVYLSRWKFAKYITLIEFLTYWQHFLNVFFSFCKFFLKCIFWPIIDHSLCSHYYSTFNLNDIFYTTIKDLKTNKNHVNKNGKFQNKCDFLIFRFIKKHSDQRIWSASYTAVQIDLNCKWNKYFQFFSLFFLTFLSRIRQVLKITKSKIKFLYKRQESN